VLLNTLDPLTTLASAAIFSAPPPTSTVVGSTESQMKPETADAQQVDISTMPWLYQMATFGFYLVIF